MFDTVKEITDAIQAKEQDSSALWQQMDDDFKLWSLEEFIPVEGYESYTTPAPRNFFDKVVDGLARAVMSIQIKLPEDASDDDREAARTGEMYLSGALNTIDRTLRLRGEPDLRSTLGFLMGLRGWMAMRALVYVPEGKKDTVFDVVPWDMRHVTFQTGAQGLIWAAHTRVVGASQILDEYGVDITTDRGLVRSIASKIGFNQSRDEPGAVVTDFWDQERNSIMIQGEFHKEPKPHNLDHVPVFIGPVGSMPTTQEGTAVQGSTPDTSVAPSTRGSSGSGTLLEHRGNSVWHAIRGQYEPWNKYVSSLMDQAQRGNAGSLFHLTQSGKSTIVGNPYETFEIVPGQIGDSLQPVPMPPVAESVSALLQILGSAMEQSSLPDPLAFGGTEAPESGRALAIRIEATRSVFNPFTGVMANGYTWLAEELLTQFHRKSLKTVNLQGFNSEEEFFRVKVKPKDIDPSWFVLVTVQPRLPRDEEAEILMAKTATTRTQESDPLISMQTARENILKLPDPDAERDRVLAERALSLPPILASETAAALKKRGARPELIQQVLSLLQPAPSAQGQVPGEQGTGASGDPVRVVVEALVAAGEDEIAEQVVIILEGGVAAGPPSPAVEVVPPAPEATPTAEPVESAVIELLRAVVAVAVQAGQAEIGIAFAQTIMAGQRPDESTVQQIVDILTALDREELVAQIQQLLAQISQAPPLPPGSAVVQT
jgi:hypothetical protein